MRRRRTPVVAMAASARGVVAKTLDERASDRMRQAGIHVASTIQILSETVADWSQEPGPEVLGILAELYGAIEADEVRAAA